MPLLRSAVVMAATVPLFAGALSPVAMTAVDAFPACPMTVPNGYTPRGEPPSRSRHGNSALWTLLWPGGTVVFAPGGSGFVLPDGSLSMKWPWTRGVRGTLTIRGKRLDAPAPPLRARIPEGYGDIGFQSTALIFPTPGCWEVTGQVNGKSLTFVTLVVKIGKGPGAGAFSNAPVCCATGYASGN